MAKKELSVILLDTGTFMQGSLEYACKAVSVYVRSKMLNKPTHEVGLVLFGTTGTRNVLNEEMAASGDLGQYEHIITEHGLGTPDLKYLMTLNSIQKGTGHSDFVDALVVAADTLNKAIEDRPELEKATVTKRVILISTFCSRVRESEGADFSDMTTALIARMNERGMRLEVVSIDIPEMDRYVREDKAHNLDILDRFIAELPSKETHIRDPLDLLGIFKAKETLARAYYSDTMTIGEMTIHVKTCFKVSQEKAPGFDRYHDKSLDPDATHKVERETEYRSVENPEAAGVEKEDRRKAYRYGKQLVPFDDADILKYSPSRGIQLIGFVPAGSIARHNFMKGSSVLVGHKDFAESGVALSALVRAMQKKGMAAILRYVPRDKGAVQVTYATPVLGTAKSPDHLLMNPLPFAEDVRSYLFPSFEAKPELLPKRDQLDAAAAVIKAMDLNKGGASKLEPEATANPTLHRLYDFLQTRAIDETAPISPPESDVLAQRVLEPPVLDMKDSLLALHGLAERFSLQPRVKTEAVAALGGGIPEVTEEEEALFRVEGDAGSRVESVGSSTPVEDFHALLAQGNQQKAMEGIAGIVHLLVDGSMGSRYYDKALQCVVAFRASAVERGCGGTYDSVDAFNRALRRLADTYARDLLREEFWRAVVRAGVGLIDSEEVPGSQVSPQEAKTFLQNNTPMDVEVAAEAPGVGEEVEDDFADME